MTITAESPTHAAPRITELTFRDLLTSTRRPWPGYQETAGVWRQLIAGGVDPSFALGQFWMESNYGVAGYTNDCLRETGQPMRAWGNILSVNSLLLARGTAGVHQWTKVRADGSRYTYAIYDTWELGAWDYALLLKQYVLRSPDPRYGDTSTIGGATAKWAADDPDSAAHDVYLSVVLQRMASADSRTPAEGDMGGLAVPYLGQTYIRLKAGELCYESTKEGAQSRYFSGEVDVKALYWVDNTSWLAVRAASPFFSTPAKPSVLFVKNVDPARVITPAAKVSG